MDLDLGPLPPAGPCRRGLRHRAPSRPGVVVGAATTPGRAACATLGFAARSWSRASGWSCCCCWRSSPSPTTSGTWSFIIAGDRGLLRDPACCAVRDLRLSSRADRAHRAAPRRSHHRRALMPPPARPADRYEPLPGLLGLPGHLLRKLSPRGRRVAAGLGVCCWRRAWPPRSSLARRSPSRIASPRRSSGARAARAPAAERARLAAEQRPRRGRARRGGAAAASPASKRRSRATPARASRAASCARRVRRTDCRALGRDGAARGAGLHAVTSDVARRRGVRGVRSATPIARRSTPRPAATRSARPAGAPARARSTASASVPLPRRLRRLTGSAGRVAQRVPRDRAGGSGSRAPRGASGTARCPVVTIMAISP